MAHPPEFLDNIRAQVGLSDVISRTVRLQRRGREHIGLCPFHNEKTPSFTVNDEKGFFHCFGCGAHGDVIGFTMQSEGLPFPEAVEKLAAMAGLRVPETSPEAQREQRRRVEISDIMERACGYYEACLGAATGQSARDYLAGRGLTPQTISRFRLGYAPPGNGLKQALTSDSVSEALLVEAGLLKRAPDQKQTYDFFRGRVMFPIFDRRDRVIAFGGRIIGKGEPKYLNSPETPLFDKGRTLYGHSLAGRPAQDKGRVIVTEGYMDVIVLSQAGFEEVVAPLGTALGESHIRLLWQMCPEPILCFDGDTAGRRAAARAAVRAMPMLRPDHSLRFAGLPVGEDPDSLVRAHGSSALEQVLGEAKTLDSVIWAMETEGRSHDTPERRAGLGSRLEKHVLQIEDRQVQFQYRQLFRRRLHELFGGYRREQLSGAADIAASRAGDVTPLRLRHDQVLLASIVNHPWLLDVHAEHLAGVTLRDPQLDKLFKEIQKVCACDSGLDSESLRNQLGESGYQEDLRRLGNSDVYVHAPFARENSAGHEVRSGFAEVIARRREAAMEAEIKGALTEFERDPTDYNWRRYEKLKADAKSALMRNGDIPEHGCGPWPRQEIA